MNNNLEVTIPEWFKYDDLVTLTTIVNEQDSSVALLLAGDNLERIRPYDPVVRVYLLTLKNGKYEFAKEMGALTFKSKEAIDHFTSQFSTYLTWDLFIDIYKNDINIVI